MAGFNQKKDADEEDKGPRVLAEGDRGEAGEVEVEVEEMGPMKAQGVPRR
jgi:hypothetical protein